MHGEDWTPNLDAEIIRLRHVEKWTTPQIASKIGRSVGAVYAHFRVIDSLKMRRQDWSVEEEARLRHLIGDRSLTLRAIAVLFDRSENSVRWKIDDLKIESNRSAHWTEDQLERLQSAIAANPLVSNASLAAIVGRSEASVRDKALELGLRESNRWSEAEIAALRAAVSVEAAVASTGRDIDSVRRKAWMLKLRFNDQPDMAWTPDRDARLRALINERGEGENAMASIAADLGRKPRNIRARALKMGFIEKKRIRGLIDDKARDEILALARAGVPVTVAAAQLGRDSRTLKAVADEAGLSFAAAPRITMGSASRAVVERRQMPHASLSPHANAVDRMRPARLPRSAGEVAMKSELIRLAAEATVPVQRIEAEPPRVRKEPRQAIERLSKAPKTVKPKAVVAQVKQKVEPAAFAVDRAKPVRLAAGSSGGVAAIMARSVAITAPAPVTPPPAAPFKARMGGGNFASIGMGKLSTRDHAVALSSGTADAVAKFLATKGVTRVIEDPLDQAISGIRKRGYTLVREGDGFLIDGRHKLIGAEALFAFAADRRIGGAGLLQAAE